MVKWCLKKSATPPKVSEIRPERRTFYELVSISKKYTASSKCKMSERPSKTVLKSQERRKASISPKDHLSSRKHQKKGESPVQNSPPAEQSPDFGISNSWVCKNSACKAILSIDDTFCKRCSCCICHLFDDNKDPSLWLVCTSESGDRDSCGLSCHIECALQHRKVGVVDLGQLMQLDGSYCCASCGKVSGILGYWKKQLNVAKDARRVDVLCYRIFLSYRLLNGTSRFKELHELVNDAKAKLETEVGPLNGVSAKMARGIVSRLPIAVEVQKLCSLAIDKADEWLTTISNTNPNHREGSLPAACRFHFEEVTSSSVVIVLLDLPSVSSDQITGYKLWYCRSRDETHSKEPICAFPRVLRRVLISNLQPCTEYSFRIISYTENANLGHSEAKCFTKSVEIIHKNPQSGGSSNARTEPKTLPAVGSTSGFKVRDLGKILRLAWAQEPGCFEGLEGIDIEECCGASETANDQLPPVTRELDLNVASVPDLNEDLIPPFESSRDDNQARSHGSGDSQNWTRGATGEVPAVDSSGKLCTLGKGSPCRMTHESVGLDDNLEYCVKTIRWLECEGRIKREFRLKLLTWFSLRSTEQERRVVSTFIRTMIDDPISLAAQLVDTFSDTISNKKPRNGFCS